MEEAGRWNEWQEQGAGYVRPRLPDDTPLNVENYSAKPTWGRFPQGRVRPRNLLNEIEEECDARREANYDSFEEGQKNTSSLYRSK